MPPLTLATPYALPFRALVSPAPLFSSGGDVRLALELAAPPTAEEVEDLAAWVLPILLLSRTGALGGDMVHPARSTIGDEEGPTAAGNSIDWLVRDCRVDERTAVMFAHLFLAVSAELPLTRLVMEPAGGGRPPVLLRHDPDLEHPYPPRWPTLPFVLDIDPDPQGPVRGLAIEFAAPLTPEQSEAVQTDLLLWGAAAMNGAYAPAPEEPTLPGLVPDEEVNVAGHLVEWGFSSDRTHDDALAGLVNVCVALHQNVLPIQVVRID